MMVFILYKNIMNKKKKFKNLKEKKKIKNYMNL